MRVAVIWSRPLGAIIALHLLRAGHEVVVCGQTDALLGELGRDGAVRGASLDRLDEELAAPRMVFVMMETAEETESVLDRLQDTLASGDVIIDCGDGGSDLASARAERLRGVGVGFLDMGIGLAEDGALFAGGEEEAFRLAEPLLDSTFGEGRCQYCGPSGAGHFALRLKSDFDRVVADAVRQARRRVEESPYHGSPCLTDLRRLLFGAGRNHAARASGRRAFGSR